MHPLLSPVPCGESNEHVIEAAFDKFSKFRLVYYNMYMVVLKGIHFMMSESGMYSHKPFAFQV